MARYHGHGDGVMSADRDDWMIVCRCEELYEIEIVEAVRAGARTFEEIKRLTRCGMGPCQWKMCRTAVAAILSSEAGLALSDIPPPRIRAPVRPVRLEELLMVNEPGATGQGPPLD